MVICCKCTNNSWIPLQRYNIFSIFLFVQRGVLCYSSGNFCDSWRISVRNPCISHFYFVSLHCIWAASFPIAKWLFYCLIKFVAVATRFFPNCPKVLPRPLQGLFAPVENLQDTSLLPVTRHFCTSIPLQRYNIFCPCRHVVAPPCPSGGNRGNPPKEAWR